MEEEFNENELEERLYAMLHYVDETQANVKTNPDVCNTIDTTPRSTLRRYWRTSGDTCSPYHKTNVPQDSSISENIKTCAPSNADKQSTPKGEKLEEAPPSPADLSMLQSPIVNNLHKTVEILDIDDEKVVELESSDEDEVIEVALPPKPTITIESSDEDEIIELPQKSPLVKEKSCPKSNKQVNVERDISASPVPSVVSSVSDEFIRGDCIALNISSRHPDNHSFDFSLHGPDLLHDSPSAKKKKKKSKDRTSTPTVNLSSEQSIADVDVFFATPKSKANKNKKQKTKSYKIMERSIPCADVYDSDSNQSTDVQKNHSYSVTDKSVPSTDVYESDSSETVKITNNSCKEKSKRSADTDSSDSSVSLKEKSDTTITTTSVEISTSVVDNTSIALKPNSTSTSWRQCNLNIVDLTDEYANVDEPDIEENIVIGNVSGFTESNDYEDSTDKNDFGRNKVPIFGSTKVPAILYEDLDFDYLKGKGTSCNRRRYSLSTLRAEMEKFYNESWGGENFNHREIQKSMSKDKKLWMIDPKDRMPTPSKRKNSCNYCNRFGHRDDTCRLKPPVCFMCGSTGHYEPRCPKKICVNCGSPNYMYSTMCRNCSTWNRIKCAECGQFGHPSSHCPDSWRRYHDTIDENSELEVIQTVKKNHQLYCSGCTRRGHLVHNCRLSLPFSGLPINSPYVSSYCPIYPRTNSSNQILDDNRYSANVVAEENLGFSAFKNDHNKRQSKSPTTHDAHHAKRRYVSTSDITEGLDSIKNHTSSSCERKTSLNIDDVHKLNDPRSLSESRTNTLNTYNRIVNIDTLTNHDNKGQVIQDNEVSDTSAAVTSARIYVTDNIANLLKTPDGLEWLKSMMEKHAVNVQDSENSFLDIRGMVCNQEAFQTELRSWINGNEISPSNDDTVVSDADQSFSNNIPKNRNNVLRKINKALESLKQDIGDPKCIFKQLTFLQNNHQKLLNQKEISPKQVSNNRSQINENLKKLNMVLLGQAGLADGSQHISELYALQEKITNFRQKNISACLRKEIGQHYHCIFTPMPRNDYSDLIQKYYGAKPAPIKFKKKKKKDKSFKLNPKPIQKINCNMGTAHQKICKIIIGNEEKGEVGRSFEPNNKEIIEKTKSKLVFYHRRLMSARPIDAGLKKTRLDLVRRLHTQIASLRNTENTSSKTLKKMKKLQNQVQLFLTNV